MNDFLGPIAAQQQQPPVRFQQPPPGISPQFNQQQQQPPLNTFPPQLLQRSSLAGLPNNGSVQTTVPQFQQPIDISQQQQQQSGPFSASPPSQAIDSSSNTFLLPKPTFFELTSTLLNGGGNTLNTNLLQHHQLSRFQIWYLAFQILPTITDNLKPDYITMIQPASLVKGIPTTNLSEALSTNHPEVLKTLVEQSSGMLTSQKSVLIQKLRNRLSEPFILRMIMESENPAEILSYFNPTLIIKNIVPIIKAVGDAGIGQVRLLPKNILSIWLAHVRKLQQPILIGDDLIGRSPIGAGNHLELTLIGHTCSDIKLIPVKDLMMVIGKYRQQLFETKRVTGFKGYDINVRNCWMDSVVEYLKNKNSTVTDKNVLTALDPVEVTIIGGKVKKRSLTLVYFTITWVMWEYLIEKYRIACFC